MRAIVQVVTEHLWKLLCSTDSFLHVQVVCLLAWLHSLLTCHNACEMVILEQFASQVCMLHDILVFCTTSGKPLPSQSMNIINRLQATKPIELISVREGLKGSH